MMLFMEFANTRSGEEMRNVHRRDFHYGTTSSGLGYVVYNLNSITWEELAKGEWNSFGWLVFVNFFVCGRLVVNYRLERIYSYMHLGRKILILFLVLDKLPKDFRSDGTSFWQRCLDAYRMVFSDWKANFCVF